MARLWLEYDTKCAATLPLYNEPTVYSIKPGAPFLYRVSHMLAADEECHDTVDSRIV